jgi:hypothetical protein
MDVWRLSGSFLHIKGRKIIMMSNKKQQVTTGAFNLFIDMMGLAVVWQLFLRCTHKKTSNKK